MDGVANGNLLAGNPRNDQFICDPLWIVERTGIRERRVADPSIATSDLAAEAVRRAIDSSGVRPDAVEFVIVATVTPDYLASPPTASLVQVKAGLPSVSALDVSAACTSFVKALEHGYTLIRSGCAKAGVVVGADIMTRIANHNDRATLPLFGDAASAFVLEATSLEYDEFGPRNFYSGSDGTFASLIEIPAGGSRRPLTVHDITDPFVPGYVLRMNGREMFKVVVPRLAHHIIPDALKKAGVASLGEVDAIVFHQANLRMIEAVQGKLNYRGIVPINIDRFANTTSASIPLCFAEALESGKIKEGMRVLFVAFGGGLTWATALMRVGDINS
jgi:3-oxoacyl-[acyl-carrier-protein] synthase-3